MQNSNPIISVVTVTFNSLPLLKKTMQSVESQDYENIEYLIIDGASSDGTADYLEKYDWRNIKFVSEPDGGIYDAMNKGIRMASGDYCIFMNAGDCFASPTVVSDV
ncbi:MAG: glycosyltransferase, partial [Bacteroidaceae bacterium]|nr:glycosyltransferase [Bacteroidaceae bacterium]